MGGLSDFRKKLQKYSTLNVGFTTQVANAIASRGEQIAKEEYSGINNVNVSRETLGSGMSKVVAEKKGISYIEFGTGIPGFQSRYPEENLPKQGVPITGSWVYYYPSEHKDILNGQIGWRLGSSFVTGRSAGMQMYRTSQRLKSEMSKIALNKIKGESGNV